MILGFSRTAASAAIGSHRYWGVMTESVSSLAIAMSEIEMHATVGGADQLTGGSATATGTAGGSSPANAVDNSTATSWVGAVFSPPSQCERWMYDMGLGNDIAVQEVSVTLTAAAGDDATRGPKDIWLLYNDAADDSWKGAYGIANQSWSLPQTVTFTDPALNGNAAHRYWVILAHTNLGTNVVAAVEIEMRASPGGADQCSGGTAIGNNRMASGGPVANAFDNNTGTTAFTDNSLCAWIGYDFGAATSVNEIAITRSSGTPLTGPHNISIMCSDDGIHYGRAWNDTLSYSSNVAVSTRP